MTADLQTSIWERIVDPSWEDLSQEAAMGLLRSKFKKADLDRMHELGAIARDGTLTAEQSEELDSYNQVGRMIAIMQSKARLVLKGIKDIDER